MGVQTYRKDPRLMAATRDVGYRKDPTLVAATIDVILHISQHRELRVKITMLHKQRLALYECLS